MNENQLKQQIKEIQNLEIFKEMGINIPPQIKSNVYEIEKHTSHTDNLEWVHDEVVVLKSKVDTSISNITILSD